MKIKLTCVVVLLAVFLVSCNASQNEADTHSTVPVTEAAATTEPETDPEHQTLMADAIAKPDLIMQEEMAIDLPEAGLKHLYVSSLAEGHVISREKLYSAYVLRDYRYRDKYFHDSYLAVKTDLKILLKDLENPSLGSALYLRDVDGDGLDEIIVQQTVDMSGGAGQFFSRVFKVVGDEIQEIFNSPTIESQFDTGFTSKLKDGFQLEIKNRFTGYKATLDFSASKRYLGFYFDESGKVTRAETIHCDSFHTFVPEDVDGDGIFEIVCLQYVSLCGHSDGIGDAKTVLKWNGKTRTFAVIQSELILYDEVAQEAEMR